MPTEKAKITDYNTCIELLAVLAESYIECGAAQTGGKAGERALNWLRHKLRKPNLMLKDIRKEENELGLKHLKRHPLIINYFKE